MFLVILEFIKSFKLYIIIGVTVLYTFGIWHVRGIYEKSKEVAALEKRLENIEKGQRKILEFNQKWDKVPHADCPLSDSERRLLK